MEFAYKHVPILHDPMRYRPVNMLASLVLDNCIYSIIYAVI